MKITTLVLPVAGMGKRLLPLTKTTPKNLVRVAGRPLLEYVLHEAVQSGIREVVLIVNPAHRSAFERYLLLNKKRFPGLRFHVREQKTPGGNGHAIVQAYELLKGKAFAVRFCDDVIIDKRPVIRSMVEIYNKYHAAILLLERVPKNLVSRFGVVGIKRVDKRNPKDVEGPIYQVTKIVEKPKAKDAPSSLTIVGGYILTPEILRNLKSVSDTLPIIADDALPLAVALQIELILHGRVFGWEFTGRRLDCGTLEKLKKAEAFLEKGAF